MEHGTIKLSKKTMKKLKDSKTHPRETYEDIIKKFIEYETHVRENLLAVNEKSIEKGDGEKNET